MTNQQPGESLEYASPIPVATTCSICHGPIGDPFYRINMKPTCANCTAQVLPVLELNTFRFGPWMLGMLYGFAAAILCGFGWALITKATNAEIGFAAIGIGYVVARAIMIGAAGRRGTSIQVLAIILSLMGVFIGKGLTAAWVFWDQFKASGEIKHDTFLMRVIVFFLAPVLTFHAFDLLWYGFAVWEAWRRTRGIRLHLEGPLSMSGAATTSPLQFDVVEPANQPGQER